MSSASTVVGAALLLALAAGLAGAAETYPVLGIAGPDRVVVQYRGLPVVVTLAHLEIPEAQRGAAQERLAALVKGRKVELLYLPGFGADADGAARVQLVADGANVNAALAASGVARFQAGAKPEPVFEQPVKEAQAKAEKGRLGIWAAGGTAPATVAAATAPAAAHATAAAPKGPFCSELDNAYYFASDSPEVEKANAKRLIYYPDEATAKRAGKKPKPASQDADLPGERTEAAADAIFAKGKEVYAQAIAKGNTPERDELYGRAFTILSRSMQIYSELCDKRPNDEQLGDKLHACMQLRYGAVKQRRFE
jgi:hypothetical protein